MKMRNIVFTLLLLSGLQVSAQQMRVPIDVKLKGEWQIKSVAVERYHMQQGNLLGKEEISRYDSIARMGSVLLNLVFTEEYCMIKQSGGRNAWDYARADSGRLELKQAHAVNTPQKDAPVQQLLLQYSFGSNGDLDVGPIVSGYMDRSTGVPVKVKYTCHYTRVH
ncbi:hypothetical protein [Chitinophaga sp. RAB17]|uniref:hypothetical protein n=1 Tax=Chitinophaga sp. RAB17 TaxID=3233049 RepID=UPI003F8FD73A